MADHASQEPNESQRSPEEVEGPGPDEVPTDRPLMSRFRDAFYGVDPNGEGAEHRSAGTSALGNAAALAFFGRVVEKPLFSAEATDPFIPDGPLPWELLEKRDGPDESPSPGDIRF